MVRSYSLWPCGGFTSALLMIMVTLSSATECTDDLLKEKPRDLVSPSRCVLDCTKWTYIRKLEIQDTQTIRFTDSAKDNLGNHCWSMPIKCNIGEHVQQAYIVLPVAGPQVEGSVEMTLLSHGDTLRPHHNPPLLHSSCGLPFDITAHFTREQRRPKLCVQVVLQQSIMGNGILRCPPFLVTMWQKRQSHPPANQGSG